jgi:hypothetical protein
VNSTLLCGRRNREKQHRQVEERNYTGKIQMQSNVNGKHMEMESKLWLLHTAKKL